MITLDEAKSLTRGTMLTDTVGKRWRVSGKPVTWATRPGEVRVPVRHGLYDHDYITERSLHLVTIASNRTSS